MSVISFWNTLATHDLERARAFYKAIGFTVRDMPAGAGGITVHPTEGSTVCVFPKAAFENMIPGTLCDATRAQEIIQSVAVDSQAGVDDLAAKATAAGAKLIGQPQVAPYGYGCGFSDPDGHVWSVLWLAGSP